MGPIVVYVVRALPGDALATLDPSRIRLLGGAARPAPLVAEAREAEVLVPTYLDRTGGALLDRLPRVRLVASYGVGTDHVDLAACRARGIAVTNTPGVLTEATADHAFALLLAAARRVCEGDRFVRAGRWVEVDPGAMLGVDVYGKTLGIVGYGRIGQAMARRARGFDMKVLHTPSRASASDDPGVALDDLLAASDFVSLHCPLTGETRGLFGRERLARMRRGAVLVNTARGAVVDEAAVAEALASGQLGAAGLDVFDDEPRVPPALRALENVVLTPHLGSGSREARAEMARLVAGEIQRFADGLPPLHPVTP